MIQGPHPSVALLTAFDQGRLDPNDWTEVEAHLAACDFCCRLLEGVNDDTLVHLLREPGEQPTAAQDEPTLRRTPPPEVPAALLDHPRYRVLELLGAGGMGWVFKAEHRLMERTVALKVIRRDLMNRPTAAERFVLEVRAAARLSHPNIVTAHDAEQAGDVHFLVMEYVHGESLESLVHRQGTLSVVQSCDAVRQAALGLQHAHERGMVHRDVKPANLLRTPDGTVKVLDFGLARFASEARGGPLTPEGAVLGTPDYVAPEQALDPQRADIRADLYSLGCTLYFLLAGRPPFGEGTVLQKLMAHQGETPRPLSVRRPALPRKLTELIERLLAKDPAQRPQTPMEVAQALLPFTTPDSLSDQGAEPCSGAGNTVVRNSPTTRGFGVPWLLVLAPMVLLLAGVSGALAWRFVWREAQPPDVPESTTPGPVEHKSPIDAGVPKTFEVRCLSSHDGAFTCAVFSRDGGIALAAGADRSVRIWDLLAGKERGRLATQRAAITAIALSPDGHRALTGGEDGVVTVWDLEKKKSLRTINAHERAVRGLVFGHDGRYFLTSGEDGRAQLWDTESIEMRDQSREFVLRPRIGFLHLAADPRQNGVATPATDSSIYTWRKGWKDWRILKGHQAPALCVSWSANFRYLLSGSADDTLRLWSMATGKTLMVFKGHSGSVLCVDLSRDSRFALSGSTDRTVRLWDVVGEQEEACLEGHTDAVIAVAFHPDGRHALSAGRDGTLRTWELPEGLSSRPLGFLESVHCVALTPDGNRSYDCIGTEVIHIWDMTNKKDIGILVGHERPVLGLALSSDGKTLASCGWDGMVKLWDTEHNTEIRTLNGHQGPVRTVAFSLDGKTLASGGEDGTVRLWDMDSGKQTVRLDGHKGEVRSVSLSPTGKLLASGGADGTVRLWEVAEQRERFRMKKHQGAVHGVALTPDDSLVASVGADGTVRLWDAATGEQKKVLRDHTGPLCAVAVAMDGTRLATGGSEGIIKIWTLPECDKAIDVRPLRDRKPISGLQFLADCMRLGSASVEGSVVIWIIMPDKKKPK
jgi:WD40 repeat protein/predicted Ser/Thr protein kinase